MIGVKILVWIDYTKDAHVVQKLTLKTLVSF